MNLPYAEDVKHYWQTSRTSPDVWMQRAKKVIEDLGGEILADAYGSAAGKAAFMLAFNIQGQDYKVVFPVLPSYFKRDAAAKIQAATMLYHDIKAKAISSTVLGIEAAFFSYMVLTDGRVSSELAKPELADVFPKLLS